MLKKLLFLCFLCFFQNLFSQQNLVINPSFEITNATIQCNAYSPGIQLPAQDWISQVNTTPDFFSATLASNCPMSPYEQAFAQQAPHSGNNFIGLYSNFSSNFKEYIRGKLLQPLSVGTPYIVEFYICLGSEYAAGLATSGYGVKFLESTAPVQNIATVYNETPDLIYTGPPISDRNNWQLISFQFTPTVPNLSELVIGNFSSSVMNSLVLVQDIYFLNYVLIDDISVTPLQPIFNIPDSICEGDEITLPAISNNGVPGTWQPQFNNQQTTTYVFTPNAYGIEPLQKTIVVKPILVPEFDQIGPFCDQMPTITSLPTVSNNGVAGSWSPTFNPNQTEIYTFLPDDAQCNATVSMKVIIDETPIFDPVPPFCNYDVNFSLPTTSLNGISGTWNPPFDPYSSKKYTFTRNSGECTQQVSLDIIVNKEFSFSLFSYCNEGEFYVEMIPSEVYVPQIDDYQWKINGNPISNQKPILRISDYIHLLQDSNLVELTITEANGCVRSEEISFFSKYLCKIQKGISPNDDGLNDYFDLMSFGGVNLKIYSRNGNIVYENANYTNQWYGQSFNEKKLPNGTYFYQIKTNVGEQFTGYIQITY